MRLDKSLLAAVVMIPVLLLTAAACGSDSQDETAVAASGTAERRAQAIAQFTAEALNATPTPTPRSTPEPTATALATATAVPPTEPAASDGDRQDSPDWKAIEALLAVQSQAMSFADIDGWYATCSPLFRERSRADDTLGRSLRLFRLEPPFSAVLEFVAEEILFSGSSSATVIWGFKTPNQYFEAVGGGSYIKEDGEWFSMGWGCA